MSKESNTKMNNQNIFCIMCGIFSAVLGYLGILMQGNSIMIGVAILLACLFFILLIFTNKKRVNKRLKLKNAFASMLVVLASSFVLLSAIFYFVQDELFLKNNYIFQPKVMTNESAGYYADEDGNIENISITTSDNINIKGWLVKNATDKKSPLIIYFGGSAQEVSSMIRYAKRFDSWSVALINYRGFGISEGVANEKSVFNDATLIYDTLSLRSDIDNEKIVTMGWSLGSAVSVYLSANRVIKNTILISPMDNMVTVFQPYFPFIPLSILMKQQFNSLSRAPLIETPLLSLIADDDKNISPESSIRLAEKWQGKNSVKRYESEDHFLLFHGNSNSSWHDIKEYLKVL